MDVDQILARRPTLALVDELAHTNAPGSRNPKRFQDVEEVLRAGINVITTLNVQHLESLHEIVRSATGVMVKERIPDYVVATADQIVNVDLSAEDLRERLQAGKIYSADRVPTAMDNFFAVEKLTHLRELAMEEIAFRLDRRRREHEQQTGTPDLGSARLMVCLSSRSPRADALLRKAARIADRLGAPWFAVYVQTPRESPKNIDAATQRHVANNLELRGNSAARRWPSKGPICCMRSMPSSRSTASRTSCWDAAIARGITTSFASRCWSVYCGPFPTSTSSWSKTRPRRKAELRGISKRGGAGASPDCGSTLGLVG